MKIKKILIANRSEIACRLISTFGKMGIRSVAVYSDVDASARYVRMADEAYALHGKTATETYLRMDKIIDIALKAKCDAVHPGYGFLSENGVFAEKVQKAGLIFIGPQADLIEKLGDKIEAKKLALKANVPVVPGASDITSPEKLKIAAADIGYPLILKAAAGGGGKGMRVVEHEADLIESFQRAQSEAMANFGDNRVFAERYVVNPRHIEIQIAADHYGNVWPLFERECSIQRRHQKVIEEAPSPFMTPDLRTKMMDAAVSLVKTSGYTSLGTVEFIVDDARNFYFLEVNTRLQVEHPVTEAITGLDLVELMVNIAAGEKLDPKKQPLTPQGHAMELRLCAENPFADFLPATGKLHTFVIPQSDVRFDTGFEEGDVISPYYDSLMAKIISYSKTRDEAITKLIGFLDGMTLKGLMHNGPFLRDVLSAPDFKAGKTHTGYIAQHYPDGFKGGFNKIEYTHLMQSALAFYQRWREVPHDCADFVVTLEDGSAFDVHIDDTAHYEVHGSFVETPSGRVHGRIKGSHHLELTLKGITFKCAVWEAHIYAFYKRLPQKAVVQENHLIKAPMPGLLLSVDVAEGADVKPGDKLGIIEAMKMENIIRSPRAGKIIKIHSTPGTSLNADDILFEFKV